MRIKKIKAGKDSEAEQCKGFCNTRREHYSLPHPNIVQVNCPSVLKYASIVIPNLYPVYEDT